MWSIELHDLETDPLRTLLKDALMEGKISPNDARRILNSHYSCGTCDSNRLVVESIAGAPWRVGCGNGHEWVLTADSVRFECGGGMVSTPSEDPKRDR
jgi:hypothetical protein